MAGKLILLFLNVIQFVILIAGDYFILKAVCCFSAVSVRHVNVRLLYDTKIVSTVFLCGYKQDEKNEMIQTNLWLNYVSYHTVIR